MSKSKPLRRAVIYLRVSTKQQAIRDGNPEGYSLPTQRAEARAKAASLGAAVVEEYIDKDTGTRTDKRPAMQDLLKRVETERDIDYVIIFKLDRWARNAREDLVNDFILEEAGAELVSCSETLDRSNSGRMLHTMLAAYNEYQSRNSGDEIRRKIVLKVKEGGTHGVARIGYKNVGEGSRRWIEVDPNTAPLIRWCFMAYATGDWSVKRLVEEATDRGLLSRGGPNTPRKPLTISQMHRVLANPYYKGIVVFNGVQYQGKHEPIIDEDTWQRVQDALASKAKGEKEREHHHYLKGTIYCGHCGSRLVVSYSKGRSGAVYPYYFCVGRQQKRTTCMLKYRPIDVVEAQIEDHYRWLKFKSEGLEAAARVVLEELKEVQEDTAQLHDRYRVRLKALDAERQRLLQAHYAEAVPLDLLKSEQQRIGDEMAYLQSAVMVSEATAEQLERTVREAVARAQNCHRGYLEAGPRVRRLMNQAFFKKVWVKEDGVVAWEFNEPFATLLRAHDVPEPWLVERYEATEKTKLDDEYEAEREPGAYYRRSPGRWVGASICRGSKANNVAERVGFEPTVP